MNVESLARSAASVLRLVRDATVSISVPLRPGVVLPGLEVKPGTVARLALTVRDGIIDFARAQLAISPALDGPLFVAIRGIEFDSDGRLALRIIGLPDVKIGPQLPKSVEELADRLERLDPNAPIALRVLGIKVASVEVQQQGAVTERLSEATTDTPGAPLIDQLHVETADITFSPGLISFGELGEVRVEEGTHAQLGGTGEALEARVHAVFRDLRAVLDLGHVEDARGTADLTIDLERDERGLPTLAVTVENASVECGAAAARLPDGDFAEVVSASIRQAEGTAELFLQPEAAQPSFRFGVRATAARAQVDHLELARGRVTIPFGTQRLPVHFGATRFSGTAHLLGEQLRARGLTDVRCSLDFARLVDRAMTVDVHHLEACGKAEVELDSEVGIFITSHDLEVKADLENGRLRSLGDRMAVAFGPRSGFDMELEEARILQSGHFTFKGHGDVTFHVDALDFVTDDVRLHGGDARIAVKSDVVLDTRNGISVDDARLRVEVGKLSAKLRHGEHWRLDFDGSDRLDGTLTHARIGLDAIVFDCEPGTKLNVSVLSGTVTLPAGVRIQVRDGTRATARFSPVRIGTDAPPQLIAQVHLEARLGINDDAPQPAWWPVHLTRLTGIGETLELDVERVALRPDGRFEIDGVRVGLSAKAARIEGEAAEIVEEIEDAAQA